MLLIDITGNGGGSEWAEAVARIFSAKQIVSKRRGMVRGEHWAEQWRSLARRRGPLQSFNNRCLSQDEACRSSSRAPVRYC